MRLRRIPGVEKEFINFPHLIVAPQEIKKGHWHSYFANDNPLHLEVGMGRGKFVKAMSEVQPDVNFIALELQDEVIFSAAKILGDDRKNVAILRGDAANLDNWFAKNEIERLYLNFSDPWPKNRHAKRRLTHPRFLQLYRNILSARGEVFFRTDVASLLEYTLITMTNGGFSLQDISLNFHESKFFQAITTEYEDRQSKKGPIYYARFVVNKS